MQKLSRLSGSRTFSFPQAGDRHYGKIEVYRRIGSCGIDVDPVNQGVRQVQIGCGDAGTIKLDVGVSFSATNPAKVAAEKGVPEPSTKSKVAKDYLRKHSLELQLSEAMQAVLRAKPDDPIRFLCESLMQNIASGGVALPTSPADKEEVAPPAPEVAAPVADEVTVAPAKAMAPVASSPSDVSLLPFGEYHAKHFLSLGDSGFAPIHAKFSRQTNPAAAPAAQPKEGTTAAPASSLLPFGEYHAKHFLSLGESGFAPIYAKFSCKANPAAAVREASKAAAPAASTAQATAIAKDYPLPMKTGGPFVANSGLFGSYQRLGLAPRMLFI